MDTINTLLPYLATPLVFLAIYIVPLLIWNRFFNKEETPEGNPEKIWREVGKAQGMTFETSQATFPDTIRQPLGDWTQYKLLNIRDGTKVQLETRLEQNALGASFSTYGHIQFNPPLPTPMTLKKRGVLGSTGDFKTGDKTFDKRVAVSTDHTERAMALLTPEARAALIELASEAHFTMTDEALRWEQPRKITKEKELATLAKAMLLLAGAMQRSALKQRGEDFDTGTGKGRSMLPEFEPEEETPEEVEESQQAHAHRR